MVAKTEEIGVFRVPIDKIKFSYEFLPMYTQKPKNIPSEIFSGQFQKFDYYARLNYVQAEFGDNKGKFYFELQMMADPYGNTREIPVEVREESGKWMLYAIDLRNEQKVKIGMYSNEKIYIYKSGYKAAIPRWPSALFSLGDPVVLPLKE